MSTHACIGIQRPNGSIDSVTCHFDGYPSHVGRVLVDSWSDLQKIDRIIDEGDLSSLDHSLESCIFYARDRGENIEDIASRTHENFTDWQIYARRDCCAAYAYLFIDGVWKRLENIRDAAGHLVSADQI